MTSLVMENVRPFPFFDLPSELRNMVYDHLMEFKKHVFEKEDDDLPPYWKEGHLVRDYCDYYIFALSSHVRLVNHQFKAEAEKQCAKLAFLKVDDESPAGYAQPLQKFFPTFELSHITSLEYRSTINHLLGSTTESSGNYGGMRYQLDMHTAWIRESTSHLEHLGDIKIKLDMSWCWGAGSWPFPMVHNFPELFDTLDQITDIAFLTSVVVRRWSKMGREWSDNLNIDPWDWVGWDKGEGWRMLPLREDQVCEDGIAEHSQPSSVVKADGENEELAEN